MKTCFTCTVILICMALTASRACTIFLITDGHNTIFFNNEDYTNPNTRIWFRPGGKDYYGCTFVGFDDGSAQGGMNEKGLAFDWWAGGYTPYQPEGDKPRARGNSSERMLETCATVDEAIEFYEAHAEDAFANATLFIADKTGASVIIGAQDGKLYFSRSDQSRALGYGSSTFQQMYQDDLQDISRHGKEILKQCVATGDGGTKYSNLFNLTTGEISIQTIPSTAKMTDLNLTSELRKGAHYYDIPQISKQVTESPRPLELAMHRMCLYEFSPLPDQEPVISERIKQVLKNGANGKFVPEYFAKELWPTIQAEREEIQVDLKKCGDLISLHLLQKNKKGRLTEYHYILIFEYVRILMQFDLDETMTIHDLKTLTAARISADE